MTQGVRQKVVRKFTKTGESTVLLASLKAGGVGLNLVRPAPPCLPPPPLPPSLPSAVRARLGQS